ncbi:unnamed protein product [Pleuronectes platessa]|uniref:Uncharacterized protein n=1 Tax=Pleuronectes platessa TaxID=8262 RepID=A0A9N7VIA6_PLEPL|nr:unnamed protein product [Pleuronectes platessa]
MGVGPLWRVRGKQLLGSFDFSYIHKLRSLQVFTASSAQLSGKLLDPIERLRMLSWVVKVVPQPPEPPSKKAYEKKEEEPAAAPPPVQAPPQVTAPPPAASTRPAPEKKVTFQDESKSKQEAETAEGNGQNVIMASSSQPGVLTWISGALPQPAASPKLSQDTTTSTTTSTTPPATEENPTARKGMLAWFAQGLEKVVPQPDLKNKDSAEVHQAAAAPAEPQVDVRQDRDDTTDNKPFPPSMMDWIKQGIEKVVPQPEISVYSKTDSNLKTEAPASTEAPPQEPPPPPKPAADTAKSSKEAEQQPESSKEAEQQPNMMGWIFSGIGRMIPQPVQKQDTGCEVQNISIVQQRTDLVLEDVGQDEDAEAKNEEKMKKEDVEKQVDQPTSSIKEEAGEAVLAHMDERVQQERLEVARVAEDIARKAAEEAVRQLEVEHSAKIVIETLPESNELPNILEEENEEDPELQNLQEESDDSINNRSPVEIKVMEEYIRGTAEEEKKPDECMMVVCPAQDDAEATTALDKAEAAAKTIQPATESKLPEEKTPSSTDVEPASKRRDLESPVPQPVTQQPQPQAPQGSQAAAAADEGGCGVPDLCSPVQSLLLRIPRAAECLRSCRKLMHDNYLLLPKLSMPTPPPELAQLTQELSQFRKEAQQFIVSHLSRVFSQHPPQP